MSTVTDALAAWDETRRDHRQFLLTSPEGHAVAHIANQVIRELTAEIARLKDCEDQVKDLNVLYCADRDHQVMMDQSTDALPGTILRATDTLREWELVSDADGHGNKGWRVRS